MLDQEEIKEDGLKLDTRRVWDEHLNGWVVKSKSQVGNYIKG